MSRSAVTSVKPSFELVSAAAAFAAGTLIGARARSQSAARTIATAAALALGVLAVARPSSERLRRAGKRRRSGHLKFSLVVPRPVEQVFALCADFENFPRFFPAVERVIDYGDGRSKWCSSTPDGRAVEWNAVTTKFVTNTVIAWRSVPGSAIDVSGTLRFSPDNDGTCVRFVVDYEVAEVGLRDAIKSLLRPRRGPLLESELRELAERMAVAPAAIAEDLPPVVSRDRVEL